MSLVDLVEDRLLQGILTHLALTEATDLFPYLREPISRIFSTPSTPYLTYVYPQPPLPTRIA